MTRPTDPSLPSDLRLKRVGELWVVEGQERPYRNTLRAIGFRWDGRSKEWWTPNLDVVDRFSELVEPADFTKMPPILTVETEDERWLRERLNLES